MEGAPRRAWHVVITAPVVIAVFVVVTMMIFPGRLPHKAATSPSPPFPPGCYWFIFSPSDMLWTECWFPSQIHRLKPHSRCDGVWRLGLGEVMRARWGPHGKRRRSDSRELPSLCEDREQEGGFLLAGKRALTRDLVNRNLDLGLPRFQKPEKDIAIV